MTFQFYIGFIDTETRRINSKKKENQNQNPEKMQNTEQ